MNKEIENVIKALEKLNDDLESIRDKISSNKKNTYQVDSYDKTAALLEDLQRENLRLDRELLEHKNFLKFVLKNIEEVMVTIKELENNE